MGLNQELRVAIIGAGIAGSAVAAALVSKGIRADVYEQADVLGEVGAGVGITIPSINALTKWGLKDSFESVTEVSTKMQIIAGDDHLLIEEDWPILTEETVKPYARFTHRADLLDTLVAPIPQNQIHLSHRLIDIQENGSTVEMTFENGKVIESDVVIAADGIYSPVRGKLIGQHEPVYSGYLAHRILIPFEEALGMASEENHLRIYVDGDNSFYLLPLTKNRNQVSVDITVPGEFALRPQLTKEQIMESIKNFGPTLQKIVDNLPMEKIVSRPLSDLDPFDTWSTNTVTLIGDAAHAMLHNRGQGANMALQDADVLADVLAEVVAGNLTVAEALKDYEEKRKPVTKFYQDLSRLFPTDQAKTAFPEKAHL